MKQLIDESKMPYGKYKSEEMQDVPAEYLFWLVDNDRATTQIQAYVNDNYDVLLKEIEE